jgi:hypothetical protein
MIWNIAAACAGFIAPCALIILCEWLWPCGEYFLGPQFHEPDPDRRWRP